ncbi:MAG TPA: hypothetical protein PLL53_15015 [Saprospiraceae bacterium]|nr:hypothetical protein [Saprospiraceae bacterium]
MHRVIPVCPANAGTNTGKLLSESYTHLEALLVKQGRKWVCLMEYQKSAATKAEWDALK